MARRTLLGLLIALCAMASGLLTSCAARPCREQAAGYLKQEMELFTEWKDAESIAGASGRIALGQPVARLQELRRKANNLKAPTCAQPHLDAFKNAMDETIAGYLSFMAQKSDAEVDRHFTSALEQYMVMTKVVNEMSLEGWVKPGAPEATDVPATHAVKYEVTGTSSSVKLNFWGENGKSERLTITLPWEKQFAQRSGHPVSVSASNAQVDRTTTITITCTIWVDGKQIATQTAFGEGPVMALCQGSVP